MTAYPVNTKFDFFSEICRTGPKSAEKSGPKPAAAAADQNRNRPKSGKKGIKRNEIGRVLYILSIAKTGGLKTAHRHQLDSLQEISQGRQPEPEARPEKRKKTGIFSGNHYQSIREGKKTPRHRNPERSFLCDRFQLIRTGTNQPPKTAPKENSSGDRDRHKKADPARIR